MAHFPHNGGHYTLMNASNGYCLQIEDGPDVTRPCPVGPFNIHSVGGIYPAAKGFAFKVKVLNSDSNSRVIRLTFEKDMIHLSHHDSGIKVKSVNKSHSKNSGKHHWVISDPGLSGAWSNENYVRLKNVWSGLHLDISTKSTDSDGNHYAIGKPFDGRARQLWKFIRIQASWDGGDLIQEALLGRKHWKKHVRDDTSLDEAWAARSNPSQSQPLD
ncbi:hypothetical protein BJX99DRAFT_253219 [Aspergillus californicus]